MTDLKIDEVVEYLKASKTWIYRNASLIGGVKIGKSWNFTKEAVDHYKLYGYGPGKKHLLHEDKGETIECGTFTKGKKMAKKVKTGTLQLRASKVTNVLEGALALQTKN